MGKKNTKKTEMGEKKLEKRTIGTARTTQNAVKTNTRDQKTRKTQRPSMSGGPTTNYWSTARNRPWCKIGFSMIQCGLNHAITLRFMDSL